MILKRLMLLALAVALVGTSCVRHTLRADEIERNRLLGEILKRSDQRTLGNDDFFPSHLAPGTDPEVQEWCAVAVGRIGNPRALPWLYEMLHSRLARLRGAAAFAVGEIGNRERISRGIPPFDKEAPAQLQSLLDDSSLEVAMRAIEALGKIGAQAAAANLVERVRNFHYTGAPGERAWLDLAIMALCRLQDATAIPVLEALAANNDTEIQWHSLNALVHMKIQGTSRALYTSLLKSPNPDVQATAARGVGNCEDPLLVLALLPLLPPHSPDSRPIPLKVRISALQALGKIRSAAGVPAIVSALDAQPIDDAHPDQINFAIQAAKVLGNIGDPGAEMALRRLIHGPSAAAVNALTALAKVLREDPERFYALGGPQGGLAGTRAWARALGEMHDSRSQTELKRMLAETLATRNGSPYSYSVPEILNALSRSGAPDLELIVVPLLTSHDVPTLRAAIAAYRPSPATKAAWRPLVLAYAGVDGSPETDIKIALVGRLEPWIHEEEVQAILRTALSDRALNVRRAAARLLELAGAAGVPADPGPDAASMTDIAYHLLATARKDRTLAVLTTAKGTIEMELFRADAPLTVANFVALARAKFYDGSSFVHATPFLAVQGIDPYNDPGGGPGSSIPCEINLHPFERGSVGMTLSSKESSSSRFFISLAPQPRQDGIYTNFGRVISGLQVVERLVPGDRIKTIEIREEAPILEDRQY